MPAPLRTSPQHAPPVLRETRYDLVTSFLMAVVLALALAVVWLLSLWMAARPARGTETVPLEIIEIPGGAEDGVVDETLRLDSPEDVSDDPSLAEIPDDPEVAETLEDVIELADSATTQAQQQFELDAVNRGRPGSAAGSGRQALGLGPGETGLPREQRWFVRFDDEGTLSDYARQLDFFGIELGVLKADGTLTYVSQFAGDTPTVRSATSGAGERRLYMTWQGGGRKIADVQLLRTAGVDVGGGVIFHFYPPETENQLAELERNYANRETIDIRRTYFLVESTGDGGFRFTVTRQTYFD